MEYCKMRHAIVSREKCQIECWSHSCCGLVERFRTWECCKDHNLRFIQSAASCRNQRDLAREAGDAILAKMDVMEAADTDWAEFMVESEEVLQLSAELERLDALANILDLAAIAADEYEDTTIMADAYNVVFAEEIAAGESAVMKPADITMKEKKEKPNVVRIVK